jgi:hypothetical protein
VALQHQDQLLHLGGIHHFSEPRAALVLDQRRHSARHLLPVSHKVACKLQRVRCRLCGARRQHAKPTRQWQQAVKGSAKAEGPLLEIICLNSQVGRQPRGWPTVTASIAAHQAAA